MLTLFLPALFEATRTGVTALTIQHTAIAP